MIGKFVKGETAVFIDAANIFYSQRTLGWRIDYRKLASYLQKEVNLTGVYYYTGHVGSKEKQQSFLHQLRSVGYQVTAKEVKFIKSHGGPDIPKGNLDVELALDAYRVRGLFDTFILYPNGDLLLRNSKGRRIRPSRSDKENDI